MDLASDSIAKRTTPSSHYNLFRRGAHFNVPETLPIRWSLMSVKHVLNLMQGQHRSGSDLFD